MVTMMPLPMLGYFFGCDIIRIQNGLGGFLKPFSFFHSLTLSASKGLGVRCQNSENRM